MAFAASTSCRHSTLSGRIPLRGECGTMSHIRKTTRLRLRRGIGGGCKGVTLAAAESPLYAHGGIQTDRTGLLQCSPYSRRRGNSLVVGGCGAAGMTSGCNKDDAAAVSAKRTAHRERQPDQVGVQRWQLGSTRPTDGATNCAGPPWASHLTAAITTHTHVCATGSGVSQQRTSRTKSPRVKPLAHLRWLHVHGSSRGALCLHPLQRGSSPDCTHKVALPSDIRRRASAPLKGGTQERMQCTMPVTTSARRTDTSRDSSRTQTRRKRAEDGRNTPAMMASSRGGEAARA